MNLILNAIDQAFGFLDLDVRSLTAFRVLLGFSLLYDLQNRVAFYDAHYQDDGIFSRKLALQHFSNENWIGLLYAGGGPWWVLTCFFCGFVAAFFVLIGYRTRSALFYSWFLQISFGSRLLFLHHSGDNLFRSLLLFSLWLPLDNTYSVTYLLQETYQFSNSKKITRASRTSALPFVTQMLVMYFFASLHKTGETWTVTYTATALSLHSLWFRKWPVGTFLIHFIPSQVLQHMTWKLQFYGPLLYFVPIPTLRTLIVFGFMGMHAGLGLSLRLETFTAIALTGTVALLPSVFWDHGVIPLNRFLRPTKYRNFSCVQIIYDAEQERRLSSSSFLFQCVKLAQITSLQPCELSVINCEVFQQTKEQETETKSSQQKEKSAQSPVLQITAGDTTLEDIDALVALFSLSPLWILVEKFFDPYFLRLKMVLFSAREDSDVEELDSADCGNFSDTIAANVKENWVQIPKTFANFFAKGLHFLWSMFWVVMIVSWHFGNVGWTDWATPEELKPIMFTWQLDQNFGGN